jgi:predicted regulator of Ras-like GTPase activity (Roadblock/LC7/MglB family)
VAAAFGEADNILSAMEVISHELALRYMLELSTDIKVAFLIDEDSALIAAAPERPSDEIAHVGAELAAEARALARERGSSSVELDVTVERGAVFVVCEDGPALVCVTGQFALPGLILHDMRIALSDMQRGARDGAR